MGSRVCSGGGLECAGLLWLCCSVVLLSLTGAGRASVGHSWGISGRLGLRGQRLARCCCCQRSAYLLRCSAAGEWGFSGAV